MVRIVEACNLNTNIRSLNIGILTDEGLLRLAEILSENTSLEELEMEETKDHQKYWTSESRGAFTEMLRHCTVLKKVSIQFAREDQEADD